MCFKCADIITLMFYLEKQCSMHVPFDLMFSTQYFCHERLELDRDRQTDILVV